MKFFPSDRKSTLEKYFKQIFVLHLPGELRYSRSVRVHVNYNYVLGFNFSVETSKKRDKENHALVFANNVTRLEKVVCRIAKFEKNIVFFHQ